jgi:hypothetical protein
LHRQSLRHHLAQLQAADELHVVREPVDLEFELAAYLCLLPTSRTVLFNAVHGHPAKIVANLLTSRERIASSIGVAPTGLQRKIVDAIAAPMAPRLVTEAPVHEVAHEAPDLGRLPVPTFFAGETGPYITAGVVVAKDPVTGLGNMSIARLKPLGGNRAFIGIAPNHHLAILLRRAAGGLSLARGCLLVNLDRSRVPRGCISSYLNAVCGSDYAAGAGLVGIHGCCSCLSWFCDSTTVPGCAVDCNRFLLRSGGVSIVSAHWPTERRSA